MGLDINVVAEPASMRALADYFQQASGRVGGARASAMSARARSAPWTGEAGEGFRAIAYQMNQEGTALMDAYRLTENQVRGHADDVDAVLRRMGDAKDVATKAGLQVTNWEILDPGSPPPDPEPMLPSDFGADADAKRQQVFDMLAWTRKAAAYAECTAMVAEARTIEQDSQSRVMGVLEEAAGRPIVTIPNFLTGLAAGYLSQQSALRTTAAAFTDIATEASAAARNATHGATKQGKNLLLALVSEARAGMTEAQANTSKMGTWLEKLPTKMQNAVTFKLERKFNGRPFLSKAPAVFKNVSGLGIVFTGVTVALDAGEGKNVTKSVVSNGSGLVAGTATGMAIGGPWGALAGAIVGTGTAIATGDLWEHANGTEYVIAPGYPGYTGRLQGPGDPGPM
jgi:uncharacterized protein YukE